MGAIWLLSLADRLEAAGLTVKRYPGWETRSRSSGGYDAVMGVVVHHDAGRAGLSEESRTRYEYENAEFKPVGAMHLHRDGSVTVGAAGATNCAGRGGPWPSSRGIIPQDRGNQNTISVEMSNNGINEAWPKAQTDAAVVVCSVLCDMAGLDPLRDIMAHFEWAPGRKIDPYDGGSPVGSFGPGYFLMNHFRQAVKDHSLEEPDMTPIPPTRTIDTRNGDGGGRLRANEARHLPVAFAQSAYLMVTVINPAGRGWVQVQPSNDFNGKPALVNFDSDTWVEKCGAPMATPGGHVWVRSTVDVDLIVDVYAQGA